MLPAGTASSCIRLGPSALRLTGAAGAGSVLPSAEPVGAGADFASGWDGSGAGVADEGRQA